MGEAIGQAVLAYFVLVFGAAFLVAFIIGIIFTLMRRTLNPQTNKLSAGGYLLQGLIWGVIGIIVTVAILSVYSYVPNLKWEKSLRTANNNRDKIILEATQIDFTELGTSKYGDDTVKAFLYAPFKVTEPMEAKSVFILSNKFQVDNMKYSSTKQCIFGAPEPQVGLAITEKPNSLNSAIDQFQSGGDVVLQPGKQYYLLKKITFPTDCKIENFEDFDKDSLPKQMF